MKSPTPFSMALDDRSLLVTNFAEGTLSVIDAVDLVQKKRVEIGEWPSKVLVVQDVK